MTSTATLRGAEQRATSSASLVLAFLAVYLIWGSTYLGIRFAIETIPPMLMAGTRFLFAGAILYGWSLARGLGSPTARQWVHGAVAGTLLLVGGNGGVVWAEQFVPSGIAALLVATTPMWMVLLEWLRVRASRPSITVVCGLALGLLGLVLLIEPAELGRGGSSNTTGVVFLLLASLAWSAGSIYTRHVDLPPSPVLTTAMEMLTGGAIFLLLSLALGEIGAFEPGVISAKSLWALIYLIIFGAVLGFTAYTHILRASTPAMVSTYAYVNPVVAVLLGWWLANEPLTPRMFVAASIIIAGVAIVTIAQARRRG